MRKYIFSTSSTTSNALLVSLHNYPVRYELPLIMNLVHKSVILLFMEVQRATQWQNNQQSSVANLLTLHSVPVGNMSWVGTNGRRLGMSRNVLLSCNSHPLAPIHCSFAWFATNANRKVQLERLAPTRSRDYLRTDDQLRMMWK